MAFLSPSWIEALDERLAHHEGPQVQPRRVLVEISDAPGGTVTLALEVSAQGVRLSPTSDESGAVAHLRIAYEDAKGINAGTLTSAGALRQGRVKVSGNVETVVEVLEWLLSAHPG